MEIVGLPKEIQFFFNNSSNLSMRVQAFDESEWFPGGVSLLLSLSPFVSISLYLSLSVSRPMPPSLSLWLAFGDLQREICQISMKVLSRNY